MLPSLFAMEPLPETFLVVDQTGVGRAVVDMIRRAKVTPQLRPITITGGHAVSPGKDQALHVPKKELVSCLQVLMQSRRFHVVPTLPNADVLVKELQNFKINITAAANEVFEAWREGQHDDLVLAVAIAAWTGERTSIGLQLGGVGFKGLNIPPPPKMQPRWRREPINEQQTIWWAKRNARP
jgi:hypothetical protein